MLRPLGVGGDLRPAQARPHPAPVYQSQYDPKALFNALKVYGQPASRLFFQGLRLLRNCARTRGICCVQPRLPYREHEDKDRDFGGCLQGPILGSRFHQRRNASKRRHQATIAHHHL